MPGKQTLLSLLTVLFVWGAAAPAPAQVGNPSTGKLLSEPLLNRHGLTRRWWGHATVNQTRDKLLYLTVDETSLFLQSSASVVTAFDAETGKHLWSRRIGATDRAIYPASSNDESLFIVSGLNLFCVRKTSGDIIWELRLPSQPSSSPVADQSRVYVGFIDGSLYAFDLKTIRNLYSQGMLPQYSEETIVWRYRTGQAINIPAVPTGKVVAFASANGSLYSVSAEDRKLIFQFETDARLSAPILKYKNTLLLASEDSSFYAVNLNNGKPLWQFTTGFVIRNAPILIDDEVYLLPERGNLFKLSAATGDSIWPKPLPRMESFLSASSSRVFAADEGNLLKIIARDSGRLEGEIPLGRLTRHLANAISDRIYLASESGLVMCLHELGRDFPRFHRHPERQPVLPDFAADGEDQPGEEPLVDPDTPAEEMPADEAPADDAPAEDPPADEAPAEDLPAEDEAAVDDPA